MNAASSRATIVLRSPLSSVGSKAWRMPSRRKRNSPRCGGPRRPPPARSRPAGRPRARRSRASGRGRACPGSTSSTTSRARPSDSNVCAPTYERSVQMPSLARIFTRPVRSAPRKAPGVPASPAAARAASQGETTLAPAASTAATPCASRAKPSQAAIEACMRRPRAVSRWCTAPAASTAGTGSTACSVVEHEVGRALAHRALRLVGDAASRPRRPSRAHSSAIRCGTRRAS